MNSYEEDQLIDQLGALRDRERRLEENDYMTAYYKGYSADGATLQEIQDQLEALRDEIARLEAVLDGFT
ncbi:hypothetical protein [Secundilactobacillus collinoides]|uniref:ABC transporter Uup C-terminal domain-containing protein n=2 Tax=Secundilactobacillus collinoides TaxID=33960 RepID=A0A0R2BMW1_SECCO|nr:hypothetical protein [Secundilactobacillus collinoides]KRM77529.1 hypothetical protein FC82_GL002884 [Secundilactobacillus collinoides DSM 20515 = JCM 1123]KZL43224.1 hypothetical protein TY91_01050 [Secundilactobacillus collinoides]